MRVLIVGGYGTFGGRIVDLLRDEPRLTFLVAGRSADAGKKFCSARAGSAATLTPCVLDRTGDLSAQLVFHAPDVVVDASGPFQSYGAAPYALLEACIEAGVNYLDLADGAAFVAGVSAYDKAARAAGIYVLSGVSSFPVLTAAVVRRLSAGFARIDTIAGAIAPSPYAGVGENVVRAIAEYAGQPVAYLGRTAKIIGRPFTQQRRYTIAPPGKLPLKSTLFSLVDVPDLRALPELWPSVRRIWMGAGPVPEVLHRLLIFCSWLVALGGVRSLAPLAPLMHWATNRLRWGEHRGGMIVEIAGAGSDGAPLARTWHMLAEDDDGPLIPSMAVEAVLRGELEGRRPAHGARAGTEAVSLDEYERLFAARTISTGVRGATPGALYPTLLGEAFATLPPAVRQMHQSSRSGFAQGRASVERGRNPLAWLAGAIMGFPRATQATSVRVAFHLDERGETWRRTFGRQSFSSRQFAGKGRSDWLLCEQFGPLVFDMALVIDRERLMLVLRRWRGFGIALPLWLAPRSTAFEAEENGLFQFDVEISHPLVGLIVRYCGTLGARTDSAQPPSPLI